MNRTSPPEFICQIPSDVAHLFQNEACGNLRIREADESTCSLYKSLPYQNPVMNCFGRECAYFNVELVFFMVLFGGCAGGILLLMMSGCTCRPSKRKRGDVEEEIFDPSSVEDIVEDLVESVDLTDGIDSGEEGVIATYIVKYVCRKGEQYITERLITAVYIFVCIRLLKKLVLKLILVVPLLLRRDWTSSAFFVIDLYIFVWFAFKQKYFPSSMYNEVHVLITGKKFKKVLFSLHLHQTVFLIGNN